MERQTINHLAKQAGCFLAHEITAFTNRIDPETGVPDNEAIKIPSRTKIEQFISQSGSRLLAEIQHDENTLVYAWLERKDWTSRYDLPTESYRSPEVDVSNLDTQSLPRFTMFKIPRMGQSAF